MAYYRGFYERGRILKLALSLPQGATRVDRMRRKLQTKAGAAIYSKRKTVVEPVFG
jgi:hypothetical protein